MDGRAWGAGSIVFGAIPFFFIGVNWFDSAFGAIILTKSGFVKLPRRNFYWLGGRDIELRNPEVTKERRIRRVGVFQLRGRLLLRR